MLKIVKLFIFVFLVHNLCFAQSAPKFTVKVSKDRVKAGEVFEYKIRAGIESKQSPKLTLPEFKHFKVISQGIVRNYSYEKRGIIITVVLDYTLTALEEGEFNLPQAGINYKREAFKSPVQKITVSGKAPGFDRENRKKGIPQSLLEGGVSI